jgi:hypothetical protein
VQQRFQPLDPLRLSSYDRRLVQGIGLQADKLEKVIIGNAQLETTAAILGLGLNLGTGVVAHGDIAWQPRREPLTLKRHPL